MPQCQARLAGEGGKLRRCRSSFSRRNHTWCKVHYDEYVTQTDAYKKVTKEAEALDVVFTGMKGMAVEGSNDREEVGSNATIVKTYVERLDRAIRGREEHHERFFSETDAAHQEYLESLREKRKVARAFLERLEARKAEFVTEDEARKRQEALKRAQENWKARVRYKAEQERKLKAAALNPPPLSEIIYRCQARLAHAEHTSCTVAIAKGQRFCHVHDIEHRALANKLNGIWPALNDSRAVFDDTVRRYKSGSSDSFSIVREHARKYVAALDEAIKLQETHQQRFGCAPQPARGIAELKEKQEAVTQQVVEMAAIENAVEAGVDFVVGAVASGVSVYFGVPWARSLVVGAAAMMGIRSARNTGA